MSSECNKKILNQLLPPYTPVSASPKVKFSDKVNVASIADNSHHPIIHDAAHMIDDTKRTAGKVGSTTFWKLPTKTVRP